MSPKNLLPIVAAAILGCQAQAAPILALTPPATISGNPGQTVGWGFTLTNTTDFLVPTGSELVISPLAGTYTDFIVGFSQFFVLGPSPESATITEPFDPGTGMGLGSFAISPVAIPGSDWSGVLRFHYSLFSVDPNDPNFNPDTDTLVPDATVSADVRVHVNAAAPVPEPSSMGLLAAALAGVLLLAGSRKAAGGEKRHRSRR